MVDSSTMNRVLRQQISSSDSNVSYSATTDSETKTFDDEAVRAFHERTGSGNEPVANGRSPPSARSSPRESTTSPQTVEEGDNVCPPTTASFSREDSLQNYLDSIFYEDNEEQVEQLLHQPASAGGAERQLPGLQNRMNQLDISTRGSVQLVSQTQPSQEAEAGNEKGVSSSMRKSTVPCKCYLCRQKFTLLGKRRKVCRNCGELVCRQCSRGRWPYQMLPKENNPQNEKSLRVCNKCQSKCESFRDTLIQGDVKKAKNILNAGKVQLFYPYQIYPKKQFPIHCAVLSGNLELVQWLVEKRCNPRVVDADGCTALSISAREGFFEISKFLIFRGYCQVTEVKDITVLQKMLRTCFIKLQRTDIQHSLTRFTHSSQSSQGTNECLPEAQEEQPFEENTNERGHWIPKNELEEEEQLRLALKMSEVEQKGVSDVQIVQATNEDVEQEEEEDSCVICWERSIDCVLVPCGHMACCKGCAAKFEECPVCRKKVSQVVKTYKT